MKLSLLIGLILSGLLCTCTFAPPAYYAKNQFINEDSCIVEMAFKARILKKPGSVNDSNTLAKVNKNQILFVSGFEKGYAIVNFMGTRGYISERYFKENIFYQHWKYEKFMARKE